MLIQALFLFLVIGLAMIIITQFNPKTATADPIISAIASNTSNNQKFLYFGQPTIDDDNDTVFPAMTNQSEGIFKYSKGVLSEVVSSGSSTPLGGKFSLVDSPSINNGRLIFHGFVKGNSLYEGIFELSNGTISKIVAVGDPMPSGGTFTDLGYTTQSINSKGDFVFYGFNGPAGDEGLGGPGLFELSNGTIYKIANIGDTTPIGGVFTNIRYGIHPINDNGDLVFQSWVSNGAASQGIFKSSHGQISLIISSTDTNGNGVPFTRIEAPSINNNGDIVFFGGNTHFPSSKGIYMIQNGHISKVLSVGDPTPIGGYFSKMGAISINDKREISFLGFVSNGPTDYGIFKISGNKMLHAVNGDIYTVGQAFSSVSMPVMNNYGLIAFSSYMSTHSQKLFVMNESSVSSVGGN